MGESPTRPDLVLHGLPFSPDPHDRSIGGHCPFCGRTDHSDPICPFVKAYEVDETGRITRVEFLTPADYGKANVVEQAQPEEPSYPRKRSIA